MCDYSWKHVGNQRGRPKAKSEPVHKTRGSSQARARQTALYAVGSKARTLYINIKSRKLVSIRLSFQLKRANRQLVPKKRLQHIILAQGQTVRALHAITSNSLGLMVTVTQILETSTSLIG